MSVRVRLYTPPMIGVLVHTSSAPWPSVCISAQSSNRVVRCTSYEPRRPRLHHSVSCRRRIWIYWTPFNVWSMPHGTRSATRSLALMGGQRAVWSQRRPVIRSSHYSPRCWHRCRRSRTVSHRRCVCAWPLSVQCTNPHNPHPVHSIYTHASRVAVRSPFPYPHMSYTLAIEV